MKIVEDTGFCTCCGNYADYNYGDENFSLITKDLANYNKYKDIYVYKCPNCGFISTDIVGEEGVMFGEVKNSLEYKNALTYNYLNGLDEDLYDNHSAEVPANLYEAYSFVCLAAHDYEKYVRTVNKAIELKEVMIRKYQKSQYELGGEEENDDEYEELYNLINQSIKTNAEQIDFYYSQAEQPTFFLKLLYIENLVRLGKKAEALGLFSSAIKSTIIKNDLKEYFNEILR